jgi:hypothetical protein
MLNCDPMGIRLEPATSPLTERVFGHLTNGSLQQLPSAKLYLYAVPLTDLTRYIGEILAKLDDRIPRHNISRLNQNSRAHDNIFLRDF